MTFKAGDLVKLIVPEPTPQDDFEPIPNPPMRVLYVISGYGRTVVDSALCQPGSMVNGEFAPDMDKPPQMFGLSGLQAS
ncbi:hypothetical protein [Sphingomonas sp. ACRSK]|uniref:hypothetical protein n=1 Tax=Sphingomonas sp. ACRSK TaxID=2918213 RepID=UPI001EF6B533|nr:hypothetical protein [Sphingomonas sp. ACRSK]MCG7349801.1 hypothetical protein [Sphingomonas sp. ACRSK]